MALKKKKKTALILSAKQRILFIENFNYKQGAYRGWYSEGTKGFWTGGKLQSYSTRAPSCPETKPNSSVSFSTIMRTALHISLSAELNGTVYYLIY